MIVLASGACFGQSSLHGTAAVAASWTDNASNASSQPVEGQRARQAAWTLDLSPGLAFFHLAPRVRYEAQYAHPFRFYLDLTNSVEQSDVLSLGGDFSLTERDTLALKLMWSYARVSDLLLIPSARDATAPTPTGTQAVLSVAADESFSHAISESWSLSQGATASQSVPVSTSSSAPAYYAITSELGLEYERPRDSYGVGIDGGYLGNTYTAQADATEPMNWSGGVSATWSHQMSATVSSQVRVGGAVAFRDFSRFVAAPTASGTLQHATRGISEALALSRTVTPDTLTGRLYLTDAARLDFVALLTRDQQFGARMSHGYAWNRILSSDVGSEKVTVWTSEFGLDWAPPRSGMVASVSYQHMQQAGVESDSELADFYRNQVTLAVSGRFPTEGVSLSRKPSIGVDARTRPLGGNARASGAAVPNPDQGKKDGKNKAAGTK